MSKVISSVKALIFKENKFLMIREKINDDEIWDLPGGKIEYQESPQQALKREIKEELCIDVKIEKSVGVWWFISNYTKHQIICHTFICTPLNKFKLDFNHNPADENIVGHEWLSKEDFLNRDLPGVSSSLRELVANL